MAYQTSFDQQFQPQYPSQNPHYFDDPMNSRDRNLISLCQHPVDRQEMWQNAAPVSFASAPPSWANIQTDERKGHDNYQQIKHHGNYHPKPIYGNESKAVDVFSGIGVWEAPQTKNKRPQQYRPPPPTVSNQDMFANIGTWDSTLVTPQKPTPKYAPMSLNTMTPYGNRAPSLESPTTSLESSPEEKNSWTSFDLILNSKSSRSSDSGSEYSTPIDPHGHWNSNLQHH